MLWILYDRHDVAWEIIKINSMHHLQLCYNDEITSSRINSTVSLKSCMQGFIYTPPKGVYTPCCMSTHTLAMTPKGLTLGVTVSQNNSYRSLSSPQLSHLPHYEGKRKNEKGAPKSNTNNLTIWVKANTPCMLAISAKVQLSVTYFVNYGIEVSNFVSIIISHSDWLFDQTFTFWKTVEDPYCPVTVYLSN